MATAATIGTVAIPNMDKGGYNRPLFLGSIAAAEGVEERLVRRALLDATVMASFAVEEFSPYSIGRLEQDAFSARRETFRAMLTVD